MRDADAQLQLARDALRLSPSACSCLQLLRGRPWARHRVPISAGRSSMTQLAADETVVDAPVIGGGGSPAQASQTEPVAPKRASAARYLWAALIARIYEVFPLLCPQCGGQMNLIAFITDGPEVRKILKHIGVEPEAPRFFKTYCAGTRPAAVGGL